MTVDGSRAILLAALVVLTGAAAVADPFGFLAPTVVLGANDRWQLDRGEPIARVLSARDRQVAIFAATQANVDGDRMVMWMRQIAELKRSTYVEAIRRFSDPPRIEDLAGLTLDDGDLEDIRRCRRGRCGLKLAGVEMDELRRVANEAGAHWKPALQDAVRHLVLRRVEVYLQRGHAALPSFDDNHAPTALGGAFSRLMAQSEFLRRSLPLFSEYLDRFPDAPMAGVESFVYWSKERISGKPIVSATHISILRRGDSALPEVIVAGKGIFATHYVTASLGLTALVRAADGRRYLVYLNRSEVDVLGSFFGRLVRVFAERRLKAEAGEVLGGLRKRLERGEPESAR